MIVPSRSTPERFLSFAVPDSSPRLKPWLASIT